jgi:peptidoglycan/LPS O-acetylase OafA/YrhL
MFFFSQNLITEKVYFMPHAWSLSVEEWFYLIIPVLVYILNKKCVIAFKESLLFVVLSIIIITPFCRFFLHQTDSFYAVYHRLDQIMYGVLFAWIKFYSPKSYSFNIRHLFLKFVFLITLYALFVLLVVRNDPSLHYNVFFKSAFPLLVGSIIISIENIEIDNTFGFKKLITSISLYSYSIYLCNMLVTTFFIDYFYQFSFFETCLGGWILFGSYLIICFFWGKCQYTLFEKPLMDLREKAVNRIDILNKLERAK